MQLNIVGRGLKVDETARKRIERRLGFALGRFGGRVVRVTVGLSDANAPPG